ncbi:MAG: EMC3/TMCO1 family protein [Candidatus Micrarchaeota archaeon]
MDFSFYIILVAVAAIVYAGISRYLQNTLVDRSKMEELQKESKALNAEYKKATDAKDQAKMEAIMKKQMELFPKMNKVMMQQFKPMIIIIAIFFAFSFGVNSINPFVEDDIHFVLFDDGGDCDKLPDDGVYTACVELNNENFGKWTATAKAKNGGSELGVNETYFLYNVKSHDEIYVEHGTGQQMLISPERETYYPGETAIINVIPPSETHEVELSISNGTFFYVDLPFKIPILDVQRIYQPHWWFIFVSLISGILISFLIKRMVKKK